MRRLLLVANPAASGFTASRHRTVVAALRGAYAVTPAWPRDAAEATRVAAEAAADGTAVVVAMGGDGIVHRVANGVAGTGTALGVIPVGTTNVFARLMGVPPSGGDAARMIAAGTPARPAPVLAITAAGPDGTLAFVAVFAAGVGFDADVVREAERTPLRKVGAGSLHYARSTLRTIPAYRKRPPDLRVAVDGVPRQAVTVMAQAHDRYTFFGRRAMTLSPDGGPAVMTVERATPRRLAAVLARAVLRRPVDAVRGVRVHHPFTVVTVDADPPVALEADGELYGLVSSLTLTVRTDVLRVVAPA